MKNLGLITLGLLVLTASCQDVIELDLPDSEPLIVINGRITDSDSTGIVLSSTAPYFSQEETPRIGGATIILYENNDSVGILNEDSLGYYSLPYKGLLGKKYHVKVVVPDGNPSLEGGVWESIPEEMKRVPEIDSMFSKFIVDDPFQADGWYPFFGFTDPMGVGDNYRLRVWLNDTAFDAASQITTYQDQFWDGRSFNDIDLPTIQFVRSNRTLGTKFEIEKGSITLRYLNFLELLSSQTSQVGSTFDPPPAPLLGNIRCISNPNRTSLGYFNTSAVRRKTLFL